jgi:DNA-binding CsgD family transcriptional regulator
MNARAEALLSRRAAACVGLPCHSVVAGVDETGRPHCGSHCAILRRAKQGLPIEPVVLQVGGALGAPTWVHLVAIPVWRVGESLPVLVHCALEFEREHRIEAYLRHVAARSATTAGSPLSHGSLTQRECEILDLLAADRGPREIAAELHVSYVTVRNHIQHLLVKLGAHSIQQAVARRLMEGRELASS